MAAIAKKLFQKNIPAPTVSGVIPLSMVAPGQTITIQSIRGKDELQRFLQTLGFVEQAKLTVVTELNGNLIVQLHDSRVAISKATASRIYTA